MYITKHEAVPVVAATNNVHGEVVNVPVPLVVKSTVPVGTREGKPWLTDEGSVTIAIHVVIDPMLTDAGRHVSVVVVGRTVAVRLVEPLLTAWV